MGGFKKTTIEPEAFIVYAPKEPHKKKDKNLFKDKSKRVKKSRGSFTHNRNQWGSSWGISQVKKKKADVLVLRDTINNSQTQSANEHPRNFICDNCGKRFSNQTELEEHVTARKLR
ncbi:hypothetical protein ACSAZK_14475 [Methanosarcina sp. Mfa9]|uniref:hypothetical protein n=1 Tax=Methanosarcina sp. Mfa9 TaxID=3439063 RepID=UPI003F826A01